MEKRTNILKKKVIIKVTWFYRPADEFSAAYSSSKETTLRAVLCAVLYIVLFSKIFSGLSDQQTT